MLLGAILFLPRQIFPQLLSTAVMAGAFPFGGKALVIALLGAIACIGGAITRRLCDDGWDVLAVDVRSADGKMVRMRDYGSAGQNRHAYVTWLPAKNAVPTAFSRSNPLRTQPVPAGS